MTDANLLLGYLDAGSPLAGGVRLDAAAAEEAVGALGAELGLEPLETASGIARVASAAMAQAVRVVTVERGMDPREVGLVPFGGAGPLHAAQIADELGMRRVVVPVASGVLSALGLIVSERRRDVVESVLLAGDALTADAIASITARLGERGRSELGAHDAELRATYDLRYAGQAFELSVAGPLEPQPTDLRTAFDEAHRRRYGYDDADAGLELVTVRVAAALPGAELAPAEARSATDRGTRPAWFDGERVDARVLGAGAGELDGPAILELPGATLVLPPGWRAGAGADAVVMERTS